MDEDWIKEAMRRAHEYAQRFADLRARSGLVEVVKADYARQAAYAALEAHLRQLAKGSEHE